MAMGVLVTDGPVKSGAMKTATDAADYGRDVFALPGDVDAPGSALAHKLIAEGAHLAVCGADILSVIAPQLQSEIGVLMRESRKQAAEEEKRSGQIESTKPMPVPADLPPQERAVLEALSKGEMEFDALCEALGMDGGTLGTLLMGLEMDGFVDALPGLTYARRT